MQARDQMSAGYERGSSGRKIDSGGAKLNGMWDMNLFSCGGENETPKSLSKMFASEQCDLFAWSVHPKLHVAVGGNALREWSAI